MRSILALVSLIAGCASSIAPVKEGPAPLPSHSSSLPSPPSTTTAPAASEKSDRELFDAAQLAALNGDKADARAGYVELIKKWPASSYVPNAYVALGDLSFEAADPAHMKEAEDEYREAVKFPPPANRVYGYALYKLAFVYWNQGDGVQALTVLMNTVKFSTQYPQEPGAATLRRAALRDVVPIFAQFGNPNRAYPFFRVMAGDDARAITMLDELANTYSTTGKLPKAQNVYKELAVRDPQHACAHGVRARFSVAGANQAAADAELKKCP